MIALLRPQPNARSVGQPEPAALGLLDGIVLKRSWAGEVRNVSLLVAIGVNESGSREILAICKGAKEEKAGWSVPQASHAQGRSIRAQPSRVLQCALQSRSNDAAIPCTLEGIGVSPPYPRLARVISFSKP